MLIFPAAASLELVRSLLKGQLTLEDVIDLEHEALAETGNIVLNACLATIANVLHRPMRMSLPSVVRGRGKELFDGEESAGTDGLVMFLFIDFSFKAREVSGFITLLMDLPAIEALKAILSDYIAALA
jgi:chemotaxis protein CheC